jgi:glycerol-3-phosphate acyltransferase PlsY
LILYFIFITSYLAGSLSSAIIVCRITGLPDPRTQGSGNPGATNVLRFGSKRIAAIVLLSDGLKGAIPVLFASYQGLTLFEICLVAFFAFLGHVYPVFFHFKGGKGVATYLGALIAVNYLAGLIFSLVWLLVAKVLKISSLSALIAIYSFTFLFLFSYK